MSERDRRPGGGSPPAVAAAGSGSGAPPPGGEPPPLPEGSPPPPRPVERVAVLVVTWNGREHLETCLPALAAQEDPGVPWRVLLLDNGSRDGTAEWVGRAHPEVEVVRSPVNLGFAAANNRLVEAAGEADAVVLLNNDTRPRPGWLRGLVAALSEAPGDVAAVSGLILDWEGERLDFARGVVTFDGHAFQLGFGRRLAEAEEVIPEEGAELPFACGGNLIARRASYLDAGGFDESYFAYLEDVDLGWRLWSGGERVVFTRRAVVHHRSSATSALLGLYHRGFLFERNAFLTAYKNLEPGLWERLMPAILLTFLSRTQALLVRNNPDGEELAVDPYAGWIADTGGSLERLGAGAEASAGTGGGSPPSGPSPSSPPLPDSASPPPAAGDPLDPATVWRKWRSYSPREFLGRALGRLGRVLTGRSWVEETEGGTATGGGREPAVPSLTDPRTVAQLRALSYLLTHLDAAAEARERVAFRRRRSDREILERFPLHLVPTYPGDEELFASAGFARWLPEDLPLVRRRLEEVMETEG